MKYVIDTSAYSEFNRGQNDLERFINPKNEIYIPLIVIAELRAGFKVGSRERFNESLLSGLLNAPNVTVINLSEATTKHYARIYAQLCKGSRTLGANDIWIAALCLEHKLPLLTLDGDFNHVKNLVCIDI